MNRLSVAAVAAFVQILAMSSARAAELPVPCIAGSCGAQVAGFNTSGQAGATVVGNTLNVKQTTDRAILNWQSFNVSADGKVIFAQPDSSSITLNRIHQGSPSRIFGAVEANGQIYLVNQNGIVFGATAQVKTAGLVASSLNISDEVFAAGIVAPELVQASRAALESDGRATVIDAQGRPVLGPDGLPLQVLLKVESGARIRTTGTGGRVILASRTVDNAGSIETPDGQTLIAAGEKVYLQPSGDASLRGLLVEVDSGGEAWNRITGDISAARGNVTIAGLAVNQQGRVSATTTVSANGSIRLLGRDTVAVTQSGGALTLDATRGGRVTLGEGSTTTVLPELADRATAVDDQVQDPSRVELNGRELTIGRGAKVIAPGGELRLVARANPALAVGDDAGSRIRIAGDALIDLSGSTASAAVERNLVTVELRANELRDSPLQRDGPLRGKAVVVDARVGTPFGDVSGALAALPRDIAERTSRGGSVFIESQGDVAIERGALIDVSGGVVNYRPGFMQTTQLVGANGQLVDIGRADPSLPYVGVVNPTVTRRFDRWGVVETLSGPRIGQYDPGYSEGRDAGGVHIAAPAMLLNGSFQAHATPGLYQRDANSIPDGGRFVLGVPGGLAAALPDFRAPSITLIQGLSTVVVGGDAAVPRNVALELPIDFLTLGGFTRAEFNSNGTFTLAPGADLALRPGSSFAVRARDIHIGSDIHNAGGAIALNADLTTDIPGGRMSNPALTIDAGVTLDVRGTWQNDLLDPVGAVFRNGGSIDLAARSFDGAPAALRLGDGVRLRASGGAWLQQNGTVSAGAGGSIALRSPLQDSIFDVGKDVSFDAFGVLGAAGGSFSIEARRVLLADGASWAPAQVFDPLAAPDATLRLGNALFSDYGFGTFNIVATGAPESVLAPDVLTVAAGTRIDARARSLALTGRLGGIPSANSVETFSSALLAPEYSLRPVSVALRVDPRDFIGAVTGRLNLEQESLLTGPSRSAFTFSSPGGVRIAGQVYARGGSVRTVLPNPTSAFDHGFDPDLSIDLTPTANLDVSGGAVLRPSDLDLRIGEILAGGNIDLVADRGSVLINADATLDVSGRAGELDLPGGPGAAGFRRELVASAGGTLTVRAPESLLLAGNLRGAAAAGTTLQAPGGTLDVGLTRSRGFGAGDPALEATYPANLRRLRVIPDAFAGRPPNGLAVLEAARIAAGGFDALRLESDGVISFDAGFELNLGRSLALDTRLLDVAPGAPVKLAAPYIALGTNRSVNAPVAATAGSGRLEMRGQLVDVIGDVALQRAGTTRIESAADLRLRGIESGGISRGSLFAAGELTLAAARIYPTTLTQFRVDVAAGAAETGGSLRLERTGTDASVPLSVGGSLTLAAPQIDQGASVLAPFGRIALEAAERASLRDGSVTSVTGVDALLPFGRVELGERWTYTLGGTLTTQSAIPERRVDIEAPHVELAGGATIDVRGGGDLYAFDWTPGTGGSRDVLAASANNGYFAILPGLASQFAPYDPQESAGSSLRAGDSVYLSGGAGLPAGTYALLPARYALLPGAWLVRSVAGFTDLAPGAGTSLPDGTTVVAGLRSFAGTGRGDARYGGFALLPGSAARELASYTDYRASRFFAERARRLELPSVALPADAGSLGLFAADSLIAAGAVRSTAASGGRGALIDIGARDLEIGAGNVARNAGAVRLDAATLGSWGAASVLLGGRRSADGGRIETVARNVLIDAGAQLAGAETLVVADEEVRVADGARLGSAARAAALETRTVALTSASGAAPAALAISSSSRFEFSRAGTAAAPAGRVTLEAGSRLASFGSLLIDAPAGAQLAGALDVNGADIGIAARAVTFGSAAAADGITVTPTLLVGLQRAASLRFASSGNIDFAESFALGSAQAPLAAVSFEAAALVAADALTSVTVYADAITLRGGEAMGSARAGGGTLDMRAQRLELAGGNLTLAGFGQARFAARDSIFVNESGALMSGGALALEAGTMSAASGRHMSFASSADLRVTRASGGASSTKSPGLGGVLDFAGANVDFGGNIQLPSGQVTVSATQNLDLRATAAIDVSGVQVLAAGQGQGSPGGKIDLSAGRDLRTESGSMLRLDGAAHAGAGRLTLASGAVMRLDGGFSAQSAGAPGGSMFVDAGTLDGFGALAAVIEDSGFHERREIRTRSGDLALPGPVSWNTRHVTLAADDGRVDIDGAIHATSADERATIELFAGRGLALRAGAQLTASSSSGLGRGGAVTLASTGGTLDLAPGARIDVSGSHEAGSVSLRAAALADDVAIDRLQSDITGTTAVRIEPTLRFDAVPEFLDQFVMDGFADDARVWLGAAAANVRSRLAMSGGPELRLQPGLELRRDGDLQLAALDLRDWRFDGEPGAITWRATGSVNVSGTLSDGFRPIGAGTTARFDLLNERSATLRLIAGADLTAANYTATRAGADADLTLLEAFVRTGTGDLELAAARDVAFVGENVGAYTGGLPGQASMNVPRGPLVAFPTGGGSLAIHAGRDVLGSSVAQSVAAWQPRQGRAGTTSDLPTRWGVDVRQFRWNAGTFGGGDLAITAGRDVNNMTAAAADAAYAQTGSALQRFAGGVMSIDAARDIGSPFLHVTAGTNTLRAGGALARSRLGFSGEPIGALFSMQDARLDVVTRGALTIESMFNPTMLAPTSTLPQLRSFFFTYGADAGFSATSVAGDVDFSANPFAFLGDQNSADEPIALQMLPPSLALSSLSGDILLAGTPTLFPADDAQLALFAARDINFRGTNLQMSDAAAATLPSAGRPATTVSFTDVQRVTQALRHARDLAPVLVHAGRDLANGQLSVPKFARIAAGRDVNDFSLLGQNLRATDQTLVTAGRDIALTRFVNSRFEVGGPGRFDALAGRDIDLGFSQGISTTGRLRNPLLPASGGADFTAIAGFAQALGVEKFVDDIITPSSEYAGLLVDYMRALNGGTALAFDAARAQFRLLDADAQRPLIIDVFFRELVFAGREANRDPASNFARGYAAIDALFAGSRDPDAEGTEGFVNPYSGDLKLAFSRIYTLAGGDINLLVPGGLVDVGLAVPPATAPTRKPSDLGIVAQRAGSVRIYSAGDVLVNQSRVFTLAGGDIAIWSTLGDIDAGRGAKSAISAPAPQVLVDGSGNVVIDLAGAVAGSGIRGILTDPTVDPGDVDLIAPAGIVNAGDAGIGAAGNLNVAAQQVVGLDNIQVGGASTGVPAETSNLGASLSGVSAVSSGASSSSTKDMANSSAANQNTKLADTALGWLDVFLEGFGEEVCKANDTTCLERNRK